MILATKSHLNVIKNERNKDIWLYCNTHWQQPTNFSDSFSIVQIIWDPPGAFIFLQCSHSISWLFSSPAQRTVTFLMLTKGDTYYKHKKNNCRFRLIISVKKLKIFFFWQSEAKIIVICPFYTTTFLCIRLEGPQNFEFWSPQFESQFL